MNTRVAAAVVAMGLLAGCGSTVQSVASSTTGSGLSVPSASGDAGLSGTSGLLSGPAGSTGGASLGTAPGGSVVAPGAASTAATAGSSGTVSGNGAPGGGAVPISPTSGPIKLGFLLTGVSNAAQFGVSVGNTYSEQQFDQAVVDALNDRGGIAGRKIEPVYAKTDTASSNWSTDYQAACATFTQDNHVVAVLGYTFDYERNFETCLASHGIPHLTTAFNIPDLTELRQYPLFWSLEVPTIDQRSLAKIQGAMATGVLTPSNRVGVLTDSCPGTQRSWTQVVLPYLQKNHINVVAQHDEGCGTGNNASEANAVAGAGNLVLDFRTKRVDRVMFISVSEAPPLLVLAEAADSQHYYPDWIVSSLAQLALQEGQAPSDQLRNAYGFGWLETQDVSPSLYTRPNASQRRCLSLIKSKGVNPSSAADFAYSYSMCESMFLYEAVLARTHGNTTGSGVINALAGLGSFQSVLNLDGASTFSVARRDDAPRYYRPIVWKDGCSCFVYTGRIFPMP